VILDLLMPDMDGFQFLDRFREDPANQRIPVIIWTIKDLSSEEHRRLRSSAQALVLKRGGGTGSLTEELQRLVRPHDGSDGA
jgi:CheY-like chemotaxis protein